MTWKILLPVPSNTVSLVTLPAPSASQESPTAQGKSTVALGCIGGRGQQLGMGHNVPLPLRDPPAERVPPDRQCGQQERGEPTKL